MSDANENVTPPPPRPPVPLPENFASLSSGEKYDFFKRAMLSVEDGEFASPEIAATYRRRIQRWYDIVELREPDRVPSYPLIAGYRARYAGITSADTFYNAEKNARATIRFHGDFRPDYATPAISMPGRALELVGIRMMAWPGGDRPDALSDDAPFQYVEGEYMRADEYDQLIANPEGFLLRSWYTRVFGNLQGLAALPDLFTTIEPGGVGMLLLALSGGPVREALDNLLRAADAAREVMLPALAAGAEIRYRWGAPNTMGALTKAPFDIIGDTMRGTRGVMLDMYRCPDKLLAACEAVLPCAVRMGVSGATRNRTPFVSMPLHKGADNFMSEEQFARFYWPTFLRLLEGLIDAGLIPFSFVEGSYNNRLDIIADSGLPPGRTIWMFDQTNMRAAKEKLGGMACIGGNVPASLIATGSAEQVDACCRDLIETCGPGGGYFLSTGATIDRAKPENIHALIQSTRKYGVKRM